MSDAESKLHELSVEVKPAGHCCNLIDGCGDGVGEQGRVAVSLETVQQVKRFSKIFAGFTLLFVGVVMLVTPGPGWPAIVGGLAILAAEFVWARRLLNRLKSEGERLRQTVMPPWNSKA